MLKQSVLLIRLDVSLIGAYNRLVIVKEAHLRHRHARVRLN